MDHPKVLGYLDVLRDKKPVGQTVAVIGAGGIGFDVSEYLLHEGESASLNPAQFFAEWGVDTTGAKRGGFSLGRFPLRHARFTCCSARAARWARAWAKPRAGFTARG